MPLLTLIIPVYNRAVLLTAALDSVCQQPFGDYEVIIVDDGSTDDTAAVLAQEAAEDRWQGRLRVLHQANAGQGAARNLAIDHAAGEYCTFLDSDDLLFPWSFEVVARTIQAHGRPPLIFGREFRFDTVAEYAAVPSEKLESVAWPDLYTFVRTNRLGGPGAVVVKTQVIRDAGKFILDRVVGEDVDLLYRLGTVSPMVQIVAPATTGYRVHDEQFTVHTDRWYLGGCSLIRRCEMGVFPGGRARRAEVRKMICREITFFSFICLYLGGPGMWRGIKLYLRTFIWQMRARHLGYLVRFPLCAALRLIGKWPLKAELRRRPVAQKENAAAGLALAS
jgi:glycosyltransferase involved in cell wall biosynthesis